MTSAEEFILEEIKKSGHPLELELLSILKSTKWTYLTPQAYYFDEDEQKSRTVDITATEPPLFNEDGSVYRPLSPLWLQYTLVIECKKTDRNLVFFPIEQEYVESDGQCLWFLENKHGGCIIDELAFPHGLGHYDPHISEVALTYEIIPRKSKNVLLEAVMQVIKYTSYNISRRREGISQDEKSKYLVSIYYPIVVIDGYIWKANYRNGDIESVTKTNHIILQTKYIDNKQGEFKSYAIDIINKKYFKDLLKIIENDKYTLEHRTIIDLEKVINEYNIDNRIL